jgi:hypothetical protein
VRLLRQILREEEEQVGLVDAGLSAAGVSEGQPPAVANWCEHVRQWLACCGGLMGDASPVAPEPASRFAGRFTLPLRPGRDARFTGVLEHKGTPGELEHMPQLTRMQRVRLFEMAAAEVPAGVLFQCSTMPLEFYRDAARQVWDEVRHSMFGQAAIEAEGGSLGTYPAFVGDYTFTRPLSPADRYVWLTIGLENRFMKYPPGKRSEYEFCRDQAKDPRMTMFQDYDWADEVVHAQMGRRWAPVLMGDHATLRQAQERGDALVAEFWPWIKQQAEADAPPPDASG